MKDVFGVFASEIYRPLVTQVLPGLIGISSWLMVLYDRSELVRRFLSSDTTLLATIAVLIAVAVGHVIEDFGSRLEITHYSRLDEKQSYGNDWDRYLRTAFEYEPIGHGYLNSILLRMKFELNGGIAFMIAAWGGLFLHTVSFPRWLWLLPLAVGCYLAIFEGATSVKLIADTRKNLLKGVIYMKGQETPPTCPWH